MTEADLVLTVRRFIAAPPERLFTAWTTPAQLMAWWGPKDVECTLAEVDLRVGGKYRLGNKGPDGGVVYIEGEFTCVERPHRLGYSWSLGPPTEHSERVTIRFDPQGAGTEVIVVHERLTPAAKAGHEAGWIGCLDGLMGLVVQVR